MLRDAPAPCFGDCRPGRFDSRGSLASAREVDQDERIAIEHVVPGQYTVRLHFAELAAEVKPGQRVFDVLIDGRK
jgi:hypothetical protein